MCTGTKNLVPFGLYAMSSLSFRAMRLKLTHASTGFRLLEAGLYKNNSSVFFFLYFEHSVKIEVSRFLKPVFAIHKAKFQ